MNALVNDQVDRLYNWLHGQSRVTLFHFTSETPQDRRSADGSNVSELRSLPLPHVPAGRKRTGHSFDGKAINEDEQPRGAHDPTSL